MHLNRLWIEAHIPHQGRMCLLDEVLDWGVDRISCRSESHRANDNPLRARGQLGVACGIEYAAQAMAVHGALLAGALAATSSPSAKPPLAGFLAGVRGVHFHVLHLDDVQGDLLCNALRVAGDAGSALYEFELRSSTRSLLRGRATVIFAAQGLQRL